MIKYIIRLFLKCNNNWTDEPNGGSLPKTVLLKLEGKIMSFSSWDLQGIAILDYFLGDQSAELLVESDCAGLERLPASIFFRDSKQLPDLEQYALSLCSGETLDIGAGAGSHSLILQQRGIAITAIDISPFAVAVMQQRGVQNALCMDALSIDTKELIAAPFDTILMLMNGIGVVKDLTGLAVFLQEIKQLLKPNGQILIDSSDLSYLQEWQDIHLGSLLTKGESYGKVRYQMEYKSVKGPPFFWLFVDQHTLQEYAQQSGWWCQVIFEEDSQYLARLILQ